MDALTVVKRAAGRLFRPWWPEPRSEVERRWKRFFLRGPVGGLVGIMFGALASSGGGPSALLFTGVSGLAGVTLMWLAGHVESFIRTRTPTAAGRTAASAAVVVDLAVGGVLGHAMAVALGAESAALFGAGATMLAAYMFVASKIFWGDWADKLVGVLSGQFGTSREPEYSYAAALAARGKVDEALDLYERASRERRDPTAPLLEGAMLLRREKRFREAVQWYRMAVRAHGLNAGRAAALTRHLLEIWDHHLDSPGGAIPDLERFLARYPDTPEAEWARRQLEQIRGRLPSGSRADDHDSAGAPW